VCDELSGVWSRFQVSGFFSQRFRLFRKDDEETFTVFAWRLENLFDRWMLAGLNEKELEQMRVETDCLTRRNLLLEQFLGALPRHVQECRKESQQMCQTTEPWLG
jgi:hypothetical protein